MTDSDPNETFLYLTTIGHKSGNPHRIEIWYVEHAGRHYMMSEYPDKSHWVKNVRANPAVRFSVGTRDDNHSAVAEQAATARLIDDSSNEPELLAAIRAKMQSKYDWISTLAVELS